MYQDEIKNTEMSIIQLIRMTGKIFKENANAIIIVTLIIFIPINIATSLIPLNEAQSNLNSLIPDGEALNNSLLNFSSIFNATMEFLKWSVTSLAIQQFFGCIAIMAIAFITYQFIEGNKIDYKVALEEAFTKWPKAVWTIIISSIIMVWLYIMLIIPAIIFAIYTNFMLYVIVIKKQKGIEALKYSYKIVKHRFWRTLSKLIFITLLQIFINSMLSQLFYYVIPNTFTYFVFGCLTTFITMFFWILQTIWFLNYDCVEPEKILRK